MSIEISAAYDGMLMWYSFFIENNNREVKQRGSFRGNSDKKKCEEVFR